MFRLKVLAIAVVSVASLMLVHAQVRQERVHFKPGASSATLTGTLKGDDTLDYVLGAKRGQTMSVTLKTDHGANYFNVLPPGSEAAIANSSTAGNSWKGELPADGDYRIRVYLMRSAARRGETAHYTLTVGITGSPAQAPARGGGDAKVAGTPYHATGKVPCSVGPDAPGSAQCSFGVIRQGGGRAEVHLASPGFDVTLHKDDIRVLRFTGNAVTGANPAQKVTFEKRGDDWLVSIDGFYHYTIPEAVIIGG
jgi:hypothetical protein